MNDILAMHTRQLEAVMRRNFAAVKSIDANLSKERAGKDAVLEEYQTHVNGHRCGGSIALISSAYLVEELAKGS